MPTQPVIVASIALLSLVGVGSYFTLPAGGESAVRAQARLNGIPKEFGDWKGADIEATEKTTKYMKVAEANAYLNRLYTNAITKKAISVSILYGNQGAMCAHDPNTCYAGSGYNGVGRGTRKELAGSTLWLSRFEKGDPTPEGLDVCWGFTADGMWAAPDNPRWSFASRGMLYKIYAQRAVAVGSSTPDADNPVLGFLNQFLPAVRDALTAE